MSKKPKTDEELKIEAEAKAAAAEAKAKAAEEKAAAKAAAAADVHQFNPKKLVGVGCGVWKYSDDPAKVTRETFQQARAQDFGIRKNDVVFVSLDGVVEIIGV